MTGDDLDLRVWVVQEAHPCTVWACAGPPGQAGDQHEYLATVATQELAAQIVAEHNLCTTPAVDDDHRGGSWTQQLCAKEAEIIRLRGDNAVLQADVDRIVELAALDAINPHTGERSGYNPMTGVIREVLIGSGWTPPPPL